MIFPLASGHETRQKARATAMPEAPNTSLKTCTKCGASKPATGENFVRKLKAFSSRCKPCLHEDKNAAWRRVSGAKNAERRAARNDDVRAADRARYAASPHGKRASVAAWRAANPDKRREIDRQQYLKFGDKKRAQAARWSADNPERRNENMRNWYREKRRTDPMYRLRSAVSAYLWWCLSTNKAGRKTEDLLGYTIDTLRQHLERQFLRGMSWDNYGEWHIDHILPQSSFSYTSPDDPEFKACWAISNLRPLWAKDNIAKLNHRTHLL